MHVARKGRPTNFWTISQELGRKVFEVFLEIFRRPEWRKPNRHGYFLDDMVKLRDKVVVEMGADRI